ncbi:hypothetical protein DL767_000024 [Monosporascus sp. MG133]|nr:hypothetical protein DL767_000024 [Monosporascus sp. MG133]
MATELDLRKQEITEIDASSVASLRLAWHKGRGSSASELVMVDPKDYGNNPDDDTGNKVYNRVKDLARTLHNFEPASDGDGPRILKCKGWYEDQAAAQFCFVYQLPPECANHSGDVEFLTLYKAYGISKPPVGTRIRLARSLAATVLSIHEKDWLHKGIRSDRILFFPSRPGGRPNLDWPRLVGFDYARRDGPNEYSEKPIVLGNAANQTYYPEDSDKHLNLYRHPSVLRNPTTTFKKIHDYYSLGIVMVEIACWKPLASLLTKSRELQGTECKEEDIRRVREILKRYEFPGSPVDIAFRMGNIYRQVVEVCLDGNFGASDGPCLLASFRQRVISELDRCII